MPRPFVPAVAAVSAPELFEAPELVAADTRSRPSSFGNFASEMAATWVTTPAESTVVTMPSWPIVTDLCSPGR